MGRGSAVDLQTQGAVPQGAAEGKERSTEWVSLKLSVRKPLLWLFVSSPGPKRSTLQAMLANLGGEDEMNEGAQDEQAMDNNNIPDIDADDGELAIIQSICL